MNFFNLIVPHTTSHSLYLVTQTFMRGHSPEFPEKKALLLTPYDDDAFARDHLEHVCVDKYKAIIDLSNPKHAAKLQTMELPASPYLLYIAIVSHPTPIDIRAYEGLGEAIQKFLSARLKRRIENLAALSALMELRYGEFYITLLFNGETISERLCVIEHSNLKESASTFPSQLILKC